MWHRLLVQRSTTLALKQASVLRNSGRAVVRTQFWQGRKQNCVPGSLHSQRFSSGSGAAGEDSILNALHIGTFVSAAVCGGVAYVSCSSELDGMEVLALRFKNQISITVEDMEAWVAKADINSFRGAALENLSIQVSLK